MPRIWLIRHAKAQAFVGGADHARPLQSERAERDAALIRTYLNDAPEQFVTSTAVRAVATAALLAGDRPIAADDALYGGGARALLAAVEDAVAEFDRVAFVGHNPGITQLVNELAGGTVTDNVPTLGVASFERGAAGWTLVSLVTPRQLRQRC